MNEGWMGSFAFQASVLLLTCLKLPTFILVNTN